MTRRPARVRPALLRLLLAVLIALGAGLVLAEPAAADMCQDAPKPVAPKTGLPGMLTTVPRDVPDAAPDPFRDPSIPLADVYGYTWGWTNYDLGCGSDFLRDPIAVTNTKSANILMSMLGGTLAGLGSLEQLAKTSSVSWLSSVTAGIADRLQGPLLGLWLPLAAVGVGGILAFRARRASYADTMRTAVLVITAAGLATFALVFPSVAAQGVDRAVVSVADAAGKQFSASATDAVNREAAYRTWLTGNFGDPDSQVARDLGPRLLAATRYTWSDAKRIQADPAAKDTIDRAKAVQFKQVAAELERRDPAAYEVFTGRGERTAPAMFGLVLAVCMGLFLGLSMLMVLIARLMMQGIALAAPLAAVIGILPTHTAALSRLWDLFTAGMLAVAKFVIAGGVMALVLGAISANPELGAGAKLFWVIVATVVGLMLTRPIRTFKTVVPGLDPNRSYLKAAASGVATYLGARLGSAEGTQAGVSEAAAGTSDHRYAPAPAAPPESLAALPAPGWAQELPTWSQVPDDRAKQTLAGAGGSLPARTGPPAQALPVGRVAWAGILGAGQSPRELPPGVGSAPLPALEAIPPNTPAAPVPSLVALPATADRVPTPPEFSRAEFSRPEFSRPEFSRPRPVVPAEGGRDVVYPTGIIVAAEEEPLYRRDGAGLGAAAGELYLAVPEPEIGDDGGEQPLILYRTPVGAGRA